jgi:hypothetical protein
VEPPRQSTVSQLSRRHQQLWAAYPWRMRLLWTIIWLIAFPIFYIYEFAIVYCLTCAFLVLWYSLDSRTRDKNEPSAYSVFNENCERLTGTFTGEQFDKSLRRGGGLVG